MSSLSWFDLPDPYIATTWTDEDAQAILQTLAWHPNHPLLPLIAKASEHINLLQDRYMKEAGDNACCCDYDEPGMICVPHRRQMERFKARTQTEEDVR